MEFGYWDHSLNSVLFVNILIVIALFTCLRLFSGAIAHINATKEILTKDNAAFGLSLAGVTFAVAIMLSGAIYGNYSIDLWTSAAYVSGFGVLGILLMSLTRIIFDKITLPEISLRDEISKGNIAVAIADTSNVLAAAIIIRSLMIWATDNALHDVLFLLVAYLISQVILTSTTYIRRLMVRYFHTGRETQDELKNGNIAMALSFGGRKIATAFAITIASNFDFFEVYDLKMIILPWILISISAVIILKIIAYIAERIVLFNVATMREILDQRNIAVGAIQATIYMAMGLLIAGL
ncbi:MAG: DUF350 domain-containing protein [Alphaproteobacteria bacterium]|nr:DUF350 domain-containing protein [Alphaproteobacteria bacterium]